MGLKKADAREYREQVDRYLRETGCDECSIDDVLNWLHDRGELELPPDALVAFYKPRFQQALRDDHVLFRGRKVRSRYCVGMKTEGEDGQMVQRYLWARADCCSDAFARDSFIQRAKASEKDRAQLFADFDYFQEQRLMQGRPLLQLNLEDYAARPLSTELAVEE